MIVLRTDIITSMARVERPDDGRSRSVQTTSPIFQRQLEMNNLIYLHRQIRRIPSKCLNSTRSITIRFLQSISIAFGSQSTYKKFSSLLPIANTIYSFSLLASFFYLEKCGALRNKPIVTPPRVPATGIVAIHDNKSRPTRCQLTAFNVPLHSPTPTVAPVMHIEVDTGNENCEKRRTVMAAPISMEHPLLGEWYVILLPMTV